MRARLDGRWVLQSYWCWWSNDFTSSTICSLVSVSPFLSLSLCTQTLSRLHQRASRALQRNLPIKTKDTQAFYRENVSIVFQPLPHTIELITQIAIECFCMFFSAIFFEKFRVFSHILFLCLRSSAVIFCVVSADVIIPPVVPVVNPVITVTQGCQWLICICGFFYLFSFMQL